MAELQQVQRLLEGAYLEVLPREREALVLLLAR